MFRLILLVAIMLSVQSISAQNYYTYFPETEGITALNKPKAFISAAGTPQLYYLQSRDAGNGTVTTVFKAKRITPAGKVTETTLLSVTEQKDSIHTPYILVTQSVTGRIVVLAKGYRTRVLYSDNDAVQWSGPVTLPDNVAIPGRHINSKLIPDSVRLEYTYLLEDRLIRTRSTDNGLTWYYYKTLTFPLAVNNADEARIISESAAETEVHAIRKTDGYTNIHYIYINNSTGEYRSNSWYRIDKDAGNVVLANVPGGKSSMLWNVNPESTNGSEIYRNDYPGFRHFFDGMTRVTKFTGNDEISGAVYCYQKVILTFLSRRDKFGNGVFYGDPFTCVDFNTPALVSDFRLSSVQKGSSYNVIAGIYVSDTVLTTKKLYYTVNNGQEKSSEFYDNGSLNDSLAGDGIYGAVIPGVFNTDSIRCRIDIVTAEGRSYKSNPVIIVPGSSKGVTETEYKLFRNYPNPFNGTTAIYFYIPVPGRVSLKVYNMLGKEVMTLTDKEYPPGACTIEMQNDSLAAGVYFYTLTAGNFTQTKKMMILK